MLKTLIQSFLPAKPHRLSSQSVWQKMHLDMPLLITTLMIMIYGLFILYSAANQQLAIVEKQTLRFTIALIFMFLLAQVPPTKYKHWAPWFFLFGLILLLVVLAIGHVGKGAERWLNLGFFSFQPSEVMKLALPMLLAWYFADKPLPPASKQILIAAILMIIPAVLIARQPDLGTAILIFASGAMVLLLVGLRWRIVIGLLLAAIASMPVLWHFMRTYQRERVLTFLNPERDPLGSGYHIIQSKIAIGSGGIWGKGWLHGSQSHLQFLPEHATDFIYAVCGEEFGLIGGVLLITLYLLIVGRALYIARYAQDSFTRLLAGSLALTFFLSVFINIGMVIGILPVVGLPLPLVSYGGTSIVTILAAFGILMSIHTHRKLVE